MVIKLYYSIEGGSLLKNENLKGRYYYLEQFQFPNKKLYFKMGCAHNQQLDTAQPPGQIMKIIFAIRQEQKNHWNQNPIFSKLLYKLSPQWDISRATDGPFVQ